MVRKERLNSYDRVTSGLVERWLKEIRKRMPRGSSISATVQLKPKYGFSAAFRLFSEGEVLSSEARGKNAAEAVTEAGRALCEHLPLEKNQSEEKQAG